MALSESRTRIDHIDPRLKSSGWQSVPYDPAKPLAVCDCQAIREYPTENGPADYALCLGGRIIAVVEAKQISLGPQNVLTQAERYSRGLTSNPLTYGEFHVPFLYSTNGEVIWFADKRDPLSRSRQVKNFHTPDALQELLSRDLSNSCQWFGQHANDHPRLREYQKEANAAVESAIQVRKRQMLVAMATGTGKTFTTVNQVYRLMKSGVGKRTLFLVDRRALAAQAVRAFVSFEPEQGLKFDKIYEVYSQRFQREDFDDDEKFDANVLPTSYLMMPHDGLAFVYVCTIQRMAINLFGRNAVMRMGDETIDEDAQKIENLPIHAFDVIIADECHRGYTQAEASLFRETLDHFDAIKIGLTATPAPSTKAYFTDIVYNYPYERAVREGHLVDYDVVAMQSNVRMNGVFLNPGEEVGLIDPETGALQTDLLEDEREFEASQIEREITAPDSNRKILEELRRYAEVHEEQYGRFPKTLIFGVNDLPHTSHADQLVRLAREVFGRGDGFVQKITGRVDRPLQRIREFRNRPEPGIVVSVDMLTTGVDIPDLEYIVFLRPVKSRILFEQMIGRGTRKGEHFPDKSHFTVFDCFDGTLLEYFRKTTGITAEPPERESKTIAQVIEDIWQNRQREYNTSCLVKRLQRIEKEMSGDARVLFAAYIPNGDLGKYARELPNALKSDFTQTMALLRNPDFQTLLVTYPKPPRTFLVAYETEDEVTSEWLVKGLDGKEYKPEDYLTAFSAFVVDNGDQIEALQILLKKPAGWSVTALSELRKNLMAAPQHFTEHNLQKAHQVKYHKPLADIISMVKHSVQEQEPLLTASERVARAIQAVTAGREFTDEQIQWLERIREHLIGNLTIDESDFEDVPVFARAGGWGKANQVFLSELPDLIKHLNEAIAV